VQLARLIYVPIIIGAKWAFDVRLSANCFLEAMRIQRRHASIIVAEYDLLQRESISLDIAQSLGDTILAEERYLQTYMRVATRLGLPSTSLQIVVEPSQNGADDVAHPSS